VSHRIIPSFRFKVKLVDPLEIASIDFINSLSDSFQISLNDAVLQVHPLINVAKWKFSQDTNRKQIQKFPLNIDNVIKFIKNKFHATTFKKRYLEYFWCNFSKKGSIAPILKMGPLCILVSIWFINLAIKLILQTFID